MFCQNCGTELPNGSKFCNRCGASIAEVQPTEKTVEKKEEQTQNKAVGFIMRAPLFISGIVMALLSWPISAWFELGVRRAGEVWNYLDSYERQVWNNADTASSVLNVFLLLSIIFTVLGLVLYIIETKGILRKSKLRNRLLLLPALIMVIVALLTYPALFQYAAVFAR